MSKDNEIIRRFTYGRAITRASHPDLLYTEPYYCMSAIFVTEDECRGFIPGGRSFADFKRPLECTTYMRTFLALITRTPDMATNGIDTSPDVDTYFIRIPDVGFLVLICIRTLLTMHTWSANICKVLRDHQKAASQPRRPPDVIENMAFFVRILNGCIHPRTAHVPQCPVLLDLTSTYAIDDATSFADMALATAKKIIRAREQSDSSRGASNTATNDSAATAEWPFVSHEIIEQIIETRPQALANPFLALCVHRVLTSVLLGAWRNTDFIATDLDGVCIIKRDNSIDFSRLPDGIVAYRINLQEIAEGWLFPDQLPPVSQLKDALLKQDPLFGRAFSDMPDDELRIHILLELPAERVPGLRFFNPVAGTGMYVESTNIGTFDMPYMPFFAARIQDAVDAGMPPDTLREFIVTQFEYCINTMADDAQSTPDCPRGAANIIRDGVSTLGLHFLDHAKRPCTTSAWIAWLLDQFNNMGISVHHTSICLRALTGVLTTYSSDNGGVQQIFTGVPGDGKTFTCDTKLREIFPSMASFSSISGQGVFSAEAQHGIRLNTVFWDEMNPKSFEKGEMPFNVFKIITACKSLARRQRCMDFTDKSTTKDSSSRGANNVAPTPVAFLIASNYELREILAPYEMNLFQDASAGKSRLCNHILPSGVSHGNRDMLNLGLAKANKIIENLTSQNVRFFFATCTVVAMFLCERLIPMAHSVEHIYYVHKLVQAFSTACPSYPSKDNRTMMHMISLPFSAAIMEQVYERVLNGKRPKINATLRDLCYILYDISVSLVPSLENIVFGCSMMFDAYNSTNMGDMFATYLLEKLEWSTFNEDEHVFKLSPVAIGVLAKAMGREPKDFVKTLKSLETLVVDTIDAKTQPTPGTSVPAPAFVAPTVVYAARQDSRSMGTWCIAPKFLWRGVDSRSQIDQLIIAVIEQGGYTADNEFYCVKFLDLRRSLIVLMADDPVLRDAGDLYLFNTLKKRYFLDFFRPSLHDDESHNWLTALSPASISQFTHETLRAVWTKYHVFISTTYVNIFGTSRTEHSRVARVVTSVVPLAGEYPLCIPSQENVRLPEVARVEVNKPLPANIMFCDPILLRATTSDTFAAWQTTPVGFTDDSDLTPAEFSRMTRLVSSFNYIDVAASSSPDDLRQFIYSKSLIALQRTNTPAGCRPFSQFNLCAIGEAAADASATAGINYIRALAASHASRARPTTSFYRTLSTPIPRPHNRTSPRPPTQQPRPTTAFGHIMAKKRADEAVRHGISPPDAAGGPRSLRESSIRAEEDYPTNHAGISSAHDQPQSPNETLLAQDEHYHHHHAAGGDSPSPSPPTLAELSESPERSSSPQNQPEHHRQKRARTLAHLPEDTHAVPPSQDQLQHL